MTREEILDELRSFAADGSDLNFGDKEDLLSLGLLDSVLFLDLIAALEERSGVEVDFLETDPAEMTSIAGLQLIFGADK